MIEKIIDGEDVLYAFNKINSAIEKLNNTPELNECTIYDLITEASIFNKLPPNIFLKSNHEVFTIPKPSLYITSNGSYNLSDAVYSAKVRPGVEAEIDLQTTLYTPINSMYHLEIAGGSTVHLTYYPFEAFFEPERPEIINTAYRTYKITAPDFQSLYIILYLQRSDPFNRKLIIASHENKQLAPPICHEEIVDENNSPGNSSYADGNGIGVENL